MAGGDAWGLGVSLKMRTSGPQKVYGLCQGYKNKMGNCVKNLSEETDLLILSLDFTFCDCANILCLLNFCYFEPKPMTNCLIIE